MIIRQSGIQLQSPHHMGAFIFQAISIIPNLLSHNSYNLFQLSLCVLPGPLKVGVKENVRYPVSAGLLFYGSVLKKIIVVSFSYTLDRKCFLCRPTKLQNRVTRTLLMLFK